jgi:UDP-glucose:(heptosyl)LPS alpha-1,3-glucosyltransferase
MRIAFLVHDYNREGGHSRYAVELTELMSEEHEVHVLANTFPANQPLYPSPALPGRRLYFHRITALRWTALVSILSFPLHASWKLASLGPFDVVHAQGWTCWQKCVTTAHICCDAWHKQRLASGFVLNWRERFFDAVIGRLEKWLYRRETGIPVIAISRRVAADLDAFYARSANVHVVPHGVDGREFDLESKLRWRREVRMELGLSENAFVSLWVGDLRKGAAAAIAAVSRNSGQTLLLVSRNETETFRQIALREGGEGRIHFLPPTNRIARYYAAADVFLFPTTYDAFGMVVLEAMAMELPVIVSRDAGAAELLTHLRDGILLDNPFDAAESAEWLRKLESDAPWRQELARHARDTARRNDWREVCRKTLAVYGLSRTVQR